MTKKKYHAMFILEYIESKTNVSVNILSQRHSQKKDKLPAGLISNDKKFSNSKAPALFYLGVVEKSKVYTYSLAHTQYVTPDAADRPFKRSLSITPPQPPPPLRRCWLKPDTSWRSWMVFIHLMTAQTTPVSPVCTNTIPVTDGSSRIAS